MIHFRLPLLALALLASHRSPGAALPVTVRSGEPYVPSAALEQEAGIAIKSLPGTGMFVACGRDRCAPLPAVLAEGTETWVPVAGLARVLNLVPRFDQERRHVVFDPSPAGPAAEAAVGRVGSLVPNLRLTRLDGTPVSIDEFRGQRVLINSWASW